MPDMEQGVRGLLRNAVFGPRISWTHQRFSLQHQQLCVPWPCPRDLVYNVVTYHTARTTVQLQRCVGPAIFAAAEDLAAQF
jgi:hypothetical protein